MATRATFGSYSFPIQFSYKPVASTKRFTVVKTFGATRVHAPPTADNMVEGDNVIEFSIEGATLSEWQALLSQFTSNVMTEKTFTGYWGDSWTVIFATLDKSQVRGNLFNITGSLQIVDSP